MKLTQFERGYLDALIWTECGPDSEMTEDASVSAELYTHVKEACAEFERLSDGCLDEAEAGDDAQNGHDLWLTRNHHGAGFWDRGYGAVGDELTEIAQGMGEVDVYEGDDNLIYIG